MFARVSKKIFDAYIIAGSWIVEDDVCEDIFGPDTSVTFHKMSFLDAKRKVHAYKKYRYSCKHRNEYYIRVADDD